MAAAVILNVLEGARAARQLRYEGKSVVTFGRGADCSQVLADPGNPPALSRRHCELAIVPPRIYVRDLGSKNGTFLNGNRLPSPTMVPAELDTLGHAQGTPVVSGDRVQIGDVVIEVLVNVSVSCTECNATWDETIDGDAPPQERKPCVECSRTVDPTAGRAPSAYAPGYTPAPPPSLPGYDIERELGRGGMGVVYLARHGDRQVALKVILPARSTEQRMRGRFLREIAVAEQLQHPNIVALVEAGSHDDLLYLATEYCHGGTVDSLLERVGGRIDPEPAVSLMLQALEGLEYGHQAVLTGMTKEDGTVTTARGLVHRDLKPANLLLGGEYGHTLKLADYGLAKSYALAGLSGATTTGAVGGTPAFMSRWQAVNYKYAGPEVDLWAAAATLYYLISGSPPRDFTTSVSRMEAVVRNRCVPLRARRADVPWRLCDVLDAALDDSGMPNFTDARRLREALAASL